MILLARYLSRGHGTSQFEVPLPAHIVLCKKVPADVEARYYRLAASSS